jgi:hypothetical protein
MPADRMPAAALRVVGEVAARGLAILPGWQGTMMPTLEISWPTGLKLSIRLRRDFTVTDAGRLLAAARRMHQGLNPGSTVDDAEVMVSSAADALYVILDHAGLAGDAVDDRLSKYRRDGPDVGGWRAEVVANDPWPLSPGPLSNCVGPGDAFALPPERILPGGKTIGMRLASRMVIDVNIGTPL